MPESVIVPLTSIVSDEAIRSGDPQIEGTRITVVDVKRRVIDGDENPHVVAGEYDIPMADLFRALAYYYHHRTELEQRERRRNERATQGGRADPRTTPR
jgi:uncharacterized protein (DUF433 family)